MSCLQCGKEAIKIAPIDGHELRECEDGHRTGLLEDTKEKAA